MRPLPICRFFVLSPPVLREHSCNERDVKSRNNTRVHRPHKLTELISFMFCEASDPLQKHDPRGFSFPSRRASAKASYRCSEALSLVE